VRRVGLAALAVSLFGGQARAGSSAEQRAAAEALFDEGLALMKSGNLSSACPKLEQSQEVDAAVGTLLYLAECYEGLGRTASAWALFREAASMANAAGQTERARTGEARASRLAASLSHLVVHVASESAALPGFKLLRGNALIPKATWGTLMPVDPGPLRLEASAPGHEPWSTTLTIAADADQQTVEIPALVAIPTVTNALSPGSAAEPARDPRTRSGQTQRTLGLVVGGLGVLGVGAGAYFGLRAIAKNDDAARLCGDSTRCATLDGQTRSEEALHAATLANISFIGGGVLLASGAALFLLAPRSNPITGLRLSPALAPRSARLFVTGDF
jgi:serine/threonine-protein kinase